MIHANRLTAGFTGIASVSLILLLAQLSMDGRVLLGL
jgi:hypothetical protein